MLSPSLFFGSVANIKDFPSALNSRAQNTAEQKRRKVRQGKG
jgi:hypothetical protein